MIAILPIVMGIVVGIGLYASVYHFLVGLRQRPRNPIHLIFALLILTVTGQIFADGIARMADTISLAVTSFKAGITLASLTVIALIWFIALYTRVKSRWFLIVLTAITGIMGLINIVRPFSIIYDEITALSFRSFPWGEQFAGFVGTPSAWQFVNIAIFLVLFGYAFYASRQQYIRGEHKQALALAAGITFVIGGTIFDFLIDFGVISFISLFPLSFFGLVVIMSLNLADEVVQAGVIKQQLVESEARYRSIVEDQPALVCRFLPDTTLTFVNRAYADYFNQPIDALIGTPFINFIPEEDRAGVMSQLASFVRDKPVVSYEHKVIDADSAIRWQQWTDRAFFDENGQVIEFQSLGSDITDRKQAEKALQDSEARLAGILDIAGEAVISIDACQKIILFNKQAEDTFGYAANEVVGQSLDILVPERFREIHRDHIGAFADSDDVSRDMGDRQELYGRRKSGEEFVIEASISKLSVEGEQYYTVVLRDITRRKQTELELAQYREHLEEVVEDRTAELSDAVEELQMLNQVSRMAATITDLPAALGLVCKTITRQLNSGAVVIRVIDPNKETMTVLARYTHNSAAEIGGEDVYPWQETSSLAMTLGQGETVVLDGEEGRKRLTNLDPGLENVQIAAMMIVPLRIRSDLMGLMAITRAEQQNSFSDNDVAVAEAVAGYVAGAIENTRLVERMQETAVAEERNRLAQDLHDSVTQTMFSIASIAETLPKVWERDPQTGREGLESLRRMTQGALSELRMLLIELRPAALLEKSLGELLRQLTAAVSARSEIMITTTITGDHPLPDQVQVALYRIAQEALNNVTKHSAASQAKSGLYCTPKQVTLQISDNGRGFDLQQQRIGGRFGLTIMAERAEEIGAEFGVKSQPGEGTQVTVVWNASHDGE